MVANTGETAFYPDLSTVLRAATLAYIRDCEALANDEKAALMRSWGIPQMTAPIRYCDDCNMPIEQCSCLPFSDVREVTE